MAPEWEVALLAGWALGPLSNMHMVAGADRKALTRALRVPNRGGFLMGPAGEAMRACEAAGMSAPRLPPEVRRLALAAVAAELAAFGPCFDAAAPLAAAHRALAAAGELEAEVLEAEAARADEDEAEALGAGCFATRGPATLRRPSSESE